MISRVVIAGLGSIGRRHLNLARRFLPEADIRVLRHAPGGEVPEAANGCFYQIADALAFAPEIAVIANPAPFHLDVALPLANLGTHLLVEKPLAVNPEGVAELVSACRDHAAVLAVGYNLRFMASLQRFKALLDKGAVGRVLSVRAEIGQYLPTWRPDTDYRRGVSAVAALGGGVLLELSHEIDYLRWIFGEIDWVHARVGRYGDLEIDVEDTAHLLLGFSPSSDGREVVANLSMDFIRHDTTRQCVAIGDAGSLRWNGIAGTVECFEPGTEWKRVFASAPVRDASYIAEWEDFLDCVSTGKKPCVHGDDGLAVVEIIEAARRSVAVKSAAPVRQVGE